MDDMGTMYMEMGRLGKAEQLERDALALREAQNDSTAMGISWMHLAMVSMEQHHLTDAAMFAELAVSRLAQQGNTATPQQKITALIYLSHVRCAQGNYTDAIRNLKSAREIAEASYRPQNFFTAYVDFLLGHAYWESGNPELASELMKKGTSGMQAELGWGHPTYVKAMKQYAAFLKQTDRAPEAAEVQRTIAQVRGARSRTDASQGQPMTVLPQ
ncbi:MAG TPA: tetratricopeptide repeat protein [Terracidiphilus sp.]|jgi:tetratricopeptide (TPR) repeat protein